MAETIEHEHDPELAAMQAEAARLDSENAAPGETPEDKETAKVDNALAAYGLARTACEAAAEFAHMQWECLEYSEPVKDMAAQKLVPVLMKYNVRSELLEKYRVEFEAGAFFAGLIFTSIKRVHEWKAIQAKAAKAGDEANVTAPQ